MHDPTCLELPKLSKLPLINVCKGLISPPTIFLHHLDLPLSPPLPLPHFNFHELPPAPPPPLRFQPQACAILHIRGERGRGGRERGRGRDEDRGFISLSRPSVKCVHHASQRARAESITTHSSVTACMKLCPPFNRDEMGMQDNALTEIEKNNV